MSKIPTVGGLILSILLSLEPSVARENGDFYICTIKEFLDKRIKEKLKLRSDFYIEWISVHKKYSVNL